MEKLNPSIKHHLLIGALIGIWLFIFIYYIRPFDDGTVNSHLWLSMSFGYGLIAFSCYGLLSIFQKMMYEKLKKWNANFEIGSLIFFNLIFLVSGYMYYKSSLFNGNYDFSEFFNILFVKTALILTPILVLARRHVTKLIPIKDDFINIRGENKLDILKIKKSELVCVSKAQNYVEIFFINNGQPNTKLIRTSLGKIQVELNFLIKVHRSHLINPSHFKTWKNNNTLYLTQKEIPISKNYKALISSL